MRENQYTSQEVQQQQQRGHRWIGFLLPLLFLLIFAFTQSFAGLIVSLAIIVLLEAFIAAAPVNLRGWNTLPAQPPLYSPPQAQPSYEQGYRGVPVPFQPPQEVAGISPQAFPSSQPAMGSGEEGDRLARLKLLGDLHHAGTLTDEEFERQKRRILQTSETEVFDGTRDEEQMLVDYPGEPPSGQ